MSENENQTHTGDENAAKNAASNNVVLTGEEHQKLLGEIDKYKNEYLYLRAEFENFRRNSIKERSDLLKFGGERIIRELLDVVDNFERALDVKVTPENLDTFTKGIQLTSNELKNLLSKNQVVEIPTEGVPFDPSVHEALSSEATDQVEPGFVFRVFKKAYKLHDKVLRPAQVVVAKKIDA